jgi:nicotinate-nucleotide pyrophosphorylase (carboxylating)
LARALLTGERVALNLLQRLSGVATLTQRFVQAVAGTGAEILDTRKTTPGLRALEKYAVRAGGGRNHRKDLGEAVLIKENHICLAGGVSKALAAAQAAKGRAAWIEIEVTNLDELRAALAHGPDVILLDNMSPALVRQAVEQVRAHDPARKIRTEASGGISLGNVREFAAAGVDWISVGALTHSAPAVDLSFEIEPA